MKKSVKIIAVLLLVGATAAGGVALYTSTAGIAAEGPAGGAPQAMPVQVTVVKPEVVQIWKNFSGHVVAVDQAEIRPQVSGRITEIRFEDGQHVEKGDILMVIDPRPYEAELAKAKAALAGAKTEASLAEKEYQRAEELIKTEAISRRLLDERTNGRQVASAAVQGAQALVKSAEINLDYAYVKAPISGKTSRAEITEGNLVQSGSSAPLLTSIVADENVYVDFEIDDQTYVNSVQQEGGEGEKQIPVRLKMLSGDLEYAGVVHSFDNRINPSSGTIRARALFENSEKVLLPGMSVSVLMGSNGDQGHIFVSEKAIGTDQDRKFVYVVGDDNKTAYREVKIGESINGKRIILSGLDEGDKVVTEGIVRIRPDMPVDPQIASATATAPEQPGEIVAPEVEAPAAGEKE